MKKLKVFLLSSILLLMSCSSAPRVAAPTQVPQLPVLEKPAQEPSFTERMENFLRGKLPEQTKSSKNGIIITANTNEQEASSNVKIKVLCEGLYGRGRVLFKIDEEIFALIIDCPLGKKV